ncbi:hypothetical protein AM593_04844, partial [Mytilus galloprovincialis]
MEENICTFHFYERSPICDEVGICRVCRRKWLGQKGNEEKCNDVICGPPCTDLEEDDFIENI